MEKENERLCPININNLEFKKGEDCVKHTRCQRGRPGVFLCGDWHWRSQACHANSPLNAKETRPTPAPPAEATSPALVWLHSYAWVSYQPMAQLSSHSSALFLHLPQVEMFLHISLFMLCVQHVLHSNRSPWRRCAAELSRGVPDSVVSCNSESTCVGMTLKRIVPLVKSARMYAQVCFGKLFIQII